VLVEQLMKSFDFDRLNGAKYHVVLENPRGSLRKRPYMQDLAWAVCHHVVDYCAFDHPIMKATDFWHTLVTWVPTGTTGNGKCCNGKCGKGSINRGTGAFQHGKVVAGPASRAFKSQDGLTAKEQKWAVPALLQDEMLACLPCSQSVESSMGEVEQQKRFVIDLFSGGQSLRPVALRHNLGYIAVDLTDYALKRLL
jgi:hypothetical protein